MKNRILFLVFVILCTCKIFASTSHSTHYGQAVAQTTGNGSVYVSTSNTAKTGSTESGTTSGNQSVSAVFNCGGNESADASTFYLYATPVDGYHFKGWSNSSSATSVFEDSNPYTLSATASSTTEGSPTTTTRYAYFEKNSEYTITYLAPENGSYTVSYTGSATQTMNSSSSVYSVTSSSNATLVATAASGYDFFGWYTSDGTYFSYEATVSYGATANVTICAKFIPSGTALFDVDGVFYYDLNKANTVASNSSAKKITLAKTGNLSAGDYTISSGVTLLLPYNSTYDVNLTSPTHNANTRVSPTPFRTLTLEKDTKITVYGNICVNALQHAGNGGGCDAGSVSGPYGYLVMKSGSNILLESGSSMSVWGYVSGDGTIETKSGATLYEFMQFMDFRGGTATTHVLAQDKLFPFNQYYIQNIEANLIIKSGATEYVTSCMNGTGFSNTSTGNIMFVGTSGLFVLSSGAYICRKYLPATDQMQYSLYGQTSISSITVKVATASINSAEYVMPLNNMIVNVTDGSILTINNYFEMLPTTKIVVWDNANFKIGSSGYVYMYDKDDWYNYAYNSRIYPVIYSPTRTKARGITDLFDACLDINGTVSISGDIYTSTRKADICSSNGTGKIVFSQAPNTSSLSQYLNNSTDSTSSFTTPFLHNGSSYAGTNFEYLTTSNVAANTTITYANGHWGWMAIWQSEDGSEIYQQSNACTEAKLSSTPPSTSPSKEGFTFDGWISERNAENQEIIYTPRYKIQDWVISLPTSKETQTVYTADVPKNMLFGVVDDATKTELNVSANYYPIDNAASYEIGDHVYYILPIKDADRWMAFTAPFDVKSVSIVNTIDESTLNSAADKTAAKKLLAAANAQFIHNLPDKIAATPSDFAAAILAAVKVNWSGCSQALTVISDYPTNETYDNANYFLYENKGNWTWNTDKYKYNTQWGTATSGAIMTQGNTYSIMFPYCPGCVSENVWDYWSGKLLLLESTDAPHTILGSEFSISTPPATSEAMISGNPTFANISIDDINKTGASLLAYSDEIANETFKKDASKTELAPSESFMLTQTGASGAPIRRVNMQTGEVTYEDAADIATGVPTFGGGRTLFVLTMDDAIRIEVSTPQLVRVYSASGSLVYADYLAAGIDLSLPKGLYIVRGEQESCKAFAE